MRDEFVDTNIHVYARDVRSGEKHDIALKLIERIWETSVGATSIQVLCEFYNVVTRKIKTPLPSDDALSVVRNLSFWNVHEPNALSIKSAALRSERLKISFWDALIVESAVALDCSILWSEDLQDRADYDGVLVRNPFRRA